MKGGHDMQNVTREVVEQVIHAELGNDVKLQVVEQELDCNSGKTKKGLVFINHNNEVKFHANYTLDTTEQKESFWSKLLKDFITCRHNILV